MPRLEPAKTKQPQAIPAQSQRTWCINLINRHYILSDSFPVRSKVLLVFWPRSENQVYDLMRHRVGKNLKLLHIFGFLNKHLMITPGAPNQTRYRARPPFPGTLSCTAPMNLRLHCFSQVSQKCANLNS